MTRASQFFVPILVFALSALFLSDSANAGYWSVFNFEEEDVEPGVIVTYDSLTDMLLDQNRTGSFVSPDPFASPNLIDSGSDGTTYWSLFNFEEEDVEPGVFVTYGSLIDMLLDQNRTGSFVSPDPFAGPNLIGSGSDGTTYWSLFNFEVEDVEPGVIVTYDSLTDMLLDQNRTGSFVSPDPFAGPNLIDIGSDGTTYWSLFNFEEEDVEPGVIVTYGSLIDMLLDQNRTGSFVSPDPFAGPNLIGGGSDNFPSTTPVPEPSSWAAMLIGFGIFGRRIRSRCNRSSSQ